MLFVGSGTTALCFGLRSDVTEDKKVDDASAIRSCSENHGCRRSLVLSFERGGFLATLGNNLSDLENSYKNSGENKAERKILIAQKSTVVPGNNVSPTNFDQ